MRMAKSGRSAGRVFRLMHYKRPQPWCATIRRFFWYDGDGQTPHPAKRIERLDATLLALDTSTPHGVLALSIARDGGRPFCALRSLDPSARHGRALIPAICELLSDQGLSPTDLDGIVVGLGPGSYTGLRIGVTAAKTLAYALGVPLVGLDSIELVARNAPSDALFVSAIGDAQRGDLYVADFHRLALGAPLERIAPTRVVALAEWADQLSDEAFVIGPALTVDRLAPAIPARFRRPDNPEENWPYPRGLLDLAREVWESGRRDDPFSLEPTYLRRSAAEDQWEKLGR